MDETRRGLGLALELLDELGVCAVFLEHHLDGDGAVEHLVAPHVDTAHPAAPKLALKQEVAGLPEYAGCLNQLFFAHRMILHPLKGQKTTLPTPLSLEPGTGPQ